MASGVFVAGERSSIALCLLTQCPGTVFVFHDLAIREGRAKDAGVLCQTSHSLSLLRGGGRETRSDGALGERYEAPTELLSKVLELVRKLDAVQANSPGQEN